MKNFFFLVFISLLFPFSSFGFDLGSQEVNRKHNIGLGSVFTPGLFSGITYENRYLSKLGIGLSATNYSINPELMSGNVNSFGAYSKYYFEEEKDTPFIEGDMHMLTISVSNTSDSVSASGPWLVVGGGYQWRWGSDDAFYVELGAGLAVTEVSGTSKLGVKVKAAASGIKIGTGVGYSF